MKTKRKPAIGGQSSGVPESRMPEIRKERERIEKMVRANYEIAIKMAATFGRNAAKLQAILDGGNSAILREIQGQELSRTKELRAGIRKQ